MMSISVEELAKKKGNFVLLDVREEWERRICHIDGDIHIPMGNLASKKKEIPENKEIVVYCHHGNRSMIAALFLKENGFRTRSLSGGIDEWAEKIDKKMRRY